jgi:molybdenum cofactor cytidylyltransferase
MTPRALKVAAVVLAAGRSSRMAPRNKLLELIEGKPVIAHTASAALGSGAGPVIVVTGFEAERIGEALRGSNLTIVYNAGYGLGLSTSLRTGLEALPPSIDGALVLLGDMPGIEFSDLNALIAAFKNRKSICIPARDGKRGNPVLWGAAYFAEMTRITGDLGAKPLMAKYPDHVIEVPIDSDGIFADIDTPSDFARLTSKP